MDNFTAHQLRFRVEVQTPMELNPHKGSAIRGALYHALRGSHNPRGWQGFCFNKDVPSCAECPLVASCPVAFLVSTLEPGSRWGQDRPRPYTIEPPLEAKTRYEPGETLEFGLTMFARALNLFPYVVLAVQGLEKGGLGKRLAENRYRRGTFRLLEAWAINPLTGQEQPVIRQGDMVVQVPDVPITHQQVMESVQQGQRSAAGMLTVEFLTPTRIVDQGELLKQPHFRPWFLRLLGRLKDLSREYGGTPLEVDWAAMREAAGRIELVEDGTHWVELESYSTRKRSSTPIGGFLGSATYKGDFRPLLPWLVWGQFTHVGKNAVKGDGMIAVSY